MKTLGEFYKEKVLTQDILAERELPNTAENVRIQPDLYRWKLYYSNSKYLVCRSEAESRFLKVFLEAGLTEIMVPEDDEYLAGILPELERLKKRIDEIIDHFIDGILDRRIREEVRHRVYGEITR
jgi:hypothetical protein